MTVNCLPGYTVNAVAFQFSQNVSCTNGQFPATICSKTPCNDPLEIPNGYWFHATKQSNFVENEVVSYRCDRCHRMVTTHSDYHRQHKNIECKNGNFSSNIECLPLLCGSAPRIQNGKAIQKSVTCGEKIEYQCNEGYEGYDGNGNLGSPSAVCLADSGQDSSDSDGFHGFFGNVVGYCKPRTCGRDQIPINSNSWGGVFVPKDQSTKVFYENGYHNFQTSRIFQNKTTYDVGDSILFECFDEFTAVYDDLNGTNSIWPDELDKIAASKDQTRLAILHPELDTNEIIYSSSNSSNLDQLLFSNGKLRSVCQIDGTWSKPTHSCECDREYQELMNERQIQWQHQRTVVCMGEKPVLKSQLLRKAVEKVINSGQDVIASQVEVNPVSTDFNAIQTTDKPVDTTIDNSIDCRSYSKKGRSHCVPSHSNSASTPILLTSSICIFLCITIIF